MTNSLTTESPDNILGRMKEGAHLAGYSLQRSMENLRWLLEDSRYEQLSAGYHNVNDFLRDIQPAFSLLNINPEERKQIAELIKELQPKASQRAIADMVGVSDKTIGADLGAEYSANNEPKHIEVAEYSAPILPPDNFDPVEQERRERQQEEKKEQREKEIQQQIAEIEKGIYRTPDGLFDTIVVDPPWPYGTKYDPSSRRAANPYPEMSLEEIANIKLPAADDCILWLWTTHKFMRYSFAILDAWGFRDVTIITWEKNRMGLGSWLRSNSEFCIMAVRGNPKVNLTNQTTVIHGPMREHSRKPDEFYEMVNTLCIGRKLDWFSREPREGWEQFGNELERFTAS